MSDEFNIKKRMIGGLDPESVAEYITEIKAENNQLKKRIINKDDGTSAKKIAELNSAVEKLNGTVEEYKNQAESYRKQLEEMKAQAENYKGQVKLLNAKIAGLEKEVSEKPEVPAAENSKIAAESLNIANHYFSQAVQMATEVSDSTIINVEKSKGTLKLSVESLEQFEKSVEIVKNQIKEIISDFDVVSDDFKKIKNYEKIKIDAVSSTDK